MFDWYSFSHILLLLDFISSFNTRLTDLGNLIMKTQEDGDMCVWDRAQFCTLSNPARPVSTAGPQTSIEYLQIHTLNQVILPSHRPGSQTVSFRYVNLSVRTKHKEHEPN